MLIEIHMLKNYPPVNLNRDDSGAPKSCYFGGVQRGRISSQCLKRSWRTSDLFRQLGSTGLRTRRMPEEVACVLREQGMSDDFIEHAEKMLTGIANKDGKENAKGSFTEQIVLYSTDDIARVAKAIQDAATMDGDIKTFKTRKAKDFIKLINDAQTRPITADIALFGRMVTSEAFRDVEAAMQVAHAISTHAVNRESDYFTAVDDLLNDGEVGAGMMGDVDFNSCCYYEYAALDLDQLSENLKSTPDCDELIRRLVPALLKTMAMTNPSGKQNTFAGQVFPVFLMLECKKDKIPLSYVNAYEEAVSPGVKGVVQQSIRKLMNHINEMDDAYGLAIEHRLWLAPKCEDETLKKGEKAASFAEMLTAVCDWMKEERA